jgi:vitamin B12 transporter
LARRTLAVLALAALSSTSALVAQERAFSLDGLVVTTSPTPRSADAISSNVTVLEGEDLRAAGLATVADALRTVSGLAVVQSGSFGAATSVFLRGGESDYVLVLLDDVQINQPGGGFDFAALTLWNVERIEIVRGPSSALHGSDAMAGVIHIITRAGHGPMTATLSTRLGSFGRRDWSAGAAGGTERTGYSISLSRSRTDGILAFNNRHDNTVASGRLSFLPDDRTRAGISFRVGDREYHYPTDDAGNAVDRNAFTYGDETVLSASLRREFSSGFDVQARVGVADTDGGADDAPDAASDTLGFFGFTSLDHIRRATVDLRANLRTGDFVATGGWEIEQERQRSLTESLSQYGASSGGSEYARENKAYYAHVTGELSRLALNVGGRLEDNERFGTFGTWQMGASWLASQRLGTRLRGSAGTSLKEPTFFENFATGFAVGNENLEPERSRSWEFGVDQVLFAGDAHVRVTWFDQSFEDLIQYTFVTSTPDGSNFFNVAAANSRGLEFEIDGVVGSFRGSASWTRLDTEVTDSGFQEGPGAAFVVGESLLRRPKHTFNARVAADAGSRVQLFADVSVVGSRADRDFTQFPAVPVQLARYSNLALGGSIEVVTADAGRPGFVLELRAQNVLDRDFEEVFSFRGPGRALYVKGVLRFGGER